MKEFWPVILITFVGFFALAAMLLVPVWRFLSREEEAGDAFTQAVEDDLVEDAVDPDPAPASNPETDQDRDGSTA